MSGQEKGTEAEQRKTLKGIVAELRMGDDGGKPAYRIGRPDQVEISMPSGQPIRSMVIEEVHISELADWIEAAAKREGGNAAALREALVWMKERINAAIHDGSLDCNEVLNKIDEALAKPQRNCDVGTAEEQAERFRNLCNKYYDDENPCNKDCPLASLDIIHGFPRCQAYWTQTPYRKEGA